MSDVLAITEELEDDQMSSNAMTIGMMALMLVLVVAVVSALGEMTWSVPVVNASEVAAAGYEPTAGSVGSMWHQINAAGQTNDLRMVAENSTGAFESMLIGVTT
jgi:hypothetical protein